MIKRQLARHPKCGATKLYSSVHASFQFEQPNRQITVAVVYARHGAVIVKCLHVMRRNRCVERPRVYILERGCDES